MGEIDREKERTEKETDIHKDKQTKSYLCLQRTCFHQHGGFQLGPLVHVLGQSPVCLDPCQW